MRASISTWSTGLVEQRDQSLDLGDLLRDVDHQQGIGAAVETHAAAWRQEAALLLATAPPAPPPPRTGLALLGQQLGDVFGIAVVDRDVLRDHLGAALDRDARVFLALLVLGQLILRRDPDHAAVATLVQALGAQDDVQRLVPRHVDQAQGDIASDGVGGDEVEVGLLGDQLQHGAYRHVLEIERDRTAAVGARGGWSTWSRPSRRSRRWHALCAAAAARSRPRIRCRSGRPATRTGPTVLSTSLVPPPLGRASMRCTGVAKSVTLSGFCSDAGNCALPTSMTTVEPSVRRSGAAPAPLKRRLSRPAPPSPRLKSILDTLMAPGSCLAGSRLEAGAIPPTAPSSGAWTARHRPR